MPLKSPMRLRLFLSGTILLSALGSSSAQSADTAQKASLNVRVVNAKTGEAVKKAVVTLTGADEGSPASFASITDAEGQGVFQALPAGNYRLSAQRNGFIPAQYGGTSSRSAGSSFALKAGQTLEITVQAVPLSVITGHVFDEDGDAVEGALVSAIRTSFSQGKRDIQRAGRVTTNDLGEYRLYGLVPGRYCVGAFVRSSAAGDSQAADGDSGMTYYPSATDMSNATPMDLAAGSTLNNIDVIVARERRVPVSGAVLNVPAGASVMVSLMPPDSSIPVKFIRKDAEYSEQTGKFEVRNVAPGTYVLLANSSIGGRLFSVRQMVTVNGTPVRNLMLPLSPGVDLPGQLRIESANALDLSACSVSLQARDQGGGGTVRVRRDGSFTVPNVVPNVYVLHVMGLPPAFYLKSVHTGELEVPPSEVDLSRGAAGALSIVASAAGGEVTGTVVGGTASGDTSSNARQAAGEATVALVPSERQRADLYRSAQTNPNGAFRLNGIAPGEYKLFAWQSMDAGTFQDPEFLLRFEDQGQPVSISENSRQSVQLKLIPEQNVN